MVKKTMQNFGSIKLRFIYLVQIIFILYELNVVKKVDSQNH